MKKLRDLSLANRIFRLSGTVILIFMLVFGWLLFQFRESLYEARRQDLEHMVDLAWQILETQEHQVVDGRVSRDQAQQHALEILRDQRFEKGNYFWINDLTPRMVMHPLQPQLEGQNLAEYVDPAGKPLFKEMVEVARQNGSGFVEYLWPRPGESRPVKKLSFVKVFPAWGWIVGAGYYVDDIDDYLFRLIFGAGTILVLVVGVALLLVTYVAQSISIPMGKAVAMIEGLERGELDSRLHLDQHDEVGRLAKAMDAFADNLQHEILTAFDCLAQGDFSFAARGMIREPLAQTNARLNALVDELNRSIVKEQENLAKTEALIAAMGDGVAIYDAELKYVYQNPVHIGLTGNHVGEPCHSVCFQQSYGCEECTVRRTLVDGEIHHKERLLSRVGEPRYIEVSTSSVRNTSGQVVSVVEIARDITQRKQAQEALIESEARYSSVFRDNFAVMLLIDPDSSAIVDANPSACEFYGYDHEQLLAMTMPEINVLNGEKEAREIEEARLLNRNHYDFRQQLKNGEVREVEVYSGPVQIQGRKLIYSIVHDVTDRKRAEEQIQHLAFHDALTELANRALLEDRLTLSLAEAARNQKQGTLIFIDLDRFKVINDSLGHHLGDRLLQEVGKRLKGLARKTDTICRTGGDEFILLLPGIDGGTNAAYFANRILDSFALPFELEGREVFISPSIGISLFPGDGEDSVTLIRNADAAMYLAKQQGRNNFQFFKPELTNLAQQRLILESDLRHALLEKQLQLHYQPQVDATTGVLIGVEALVRWPHPTQGWISPVRFIPIAEECGLIESLGYWVLHTACTQNKAWQESGYPPIRMAVNVSGRQFQQANFIETVDRVLAETGLDPRFLEVEVTENIIMENVEETVQTLNSLKARKISLAIDDFGTGYSSLSYLRQFPIDRLKIDRSFVINIIQDADDAAIASAVIGLAKTLNLEVIAEGVETVEQAEFLRERQCDLLQGYYFSRPVPPQELALRLKSISPLSGESSAGSLTIQTGDC